MDPTDRYRTSRESSPKPGSSSMPSINRFTLPAFVFPGLKSKIGGHVGHGFFMSLLGCFLRAKRHRWRSSATPVSSSAKANSPYAVQTPPEAGEWLQSINNRGGVLHNKAKDLDITRRSVNSLSGEPWSNELLIPSRRVETMISLSERGFGPSIRFGPLTGYTSWSIGDQTNAREFPTKCVTPPPPF